MPEIIDQLICDPVAFAPDRVELDLSGVGLSVVEANWGEAAVETEMVRQDLGEAVTDRHLPNKEVVLKLRVNAEGETPLPTVAYELQQKVGRWQEEGGWLERVFKVGGDFAGSLACQVKKATLADFGGWQRGDSPDVTLILVTGPLWYATVEQESAVFSEETARALIFELSNLLGTHPGLIHIRVTNNGEADWRGLIYAAECRDHPQDETAETTAALEYQAADLTLKGGSTDIGGGVIEHANLTAGWLAILNSEIAGVGHMTHKGVRRLRIRAEDLGANPGDVQLRLRWRTLGALAWSENQIVPSPVADAPQLLDMGEARPQMAVIGDERWEWELQARAPSGAGKVRVKEVYPLPTEQYAVVSSPAIAQAADEQSQKSPGTVEDDDSVGTVEWSNPGNAKTPDDSAATATLAAGQASHYLNATNFTFALPEGAMIAGIIASIERSTDGESENSPLAYLRIIKGGVGGTEDPDFSFWEPSDTVATVGSSSDLWGEEWAASDINGSGFGVGLRVHAIFGAITARVDHIALTVYYTETPDENRICYQSRSIEIRSNGIYRQHPEDDVWGRVVEEGFPPVGSPSGLEGRTMRSIVIPSQGDLALLSDAGSNPLNAQALTRASYLFAREAVS